MLKKDLFGEVWRVSEGPESFILRDTQPARWWLGRVARSLMRREARALQRLVAIEGIPQLRRLSSRSLQRSYIAGAPIHDSQPRDALFYRRAMRLLRRIHTAGVAHNDLAKESNVLAQDDARPAFVDFQLAFCSRNRGRLFRLAAREDIRHLLKHKRSYRADLLTHREKAILASPSYLSLLWMSLLKPVYLFVTRRLLNWSDREGAADR
jgi:RIO-like serine/threonine protein kinase